MGSWLYAEKYFINTATPWLNIGIGDLTPYHRNPWTEALAGKKVLVISPFAESIEKQYARRELLFEDSRVLPLFELKTIKAVQTIAGNRAGFNNWFGALDSMKRQVDATDFDVALIGCGAYGLPLTAHIKRLGKKAIHIGGATQVFFGITGKRFSDAGFVGNEYWVRPMESERPKGFDKVEGGCYW